MTAPTSARRTLAPVLDRLLQLGLLSPYAPRGEPVDGSGGRPWRRRLLRIDIATLRANVGLGVRYVPLQALAWPDPFSRAFGTGEQVLMELIASGMVLAAPPPPASAVAAVGRGSEPEIAWLAPLLMLPRGGRS